MDTKRMQVLTVHAAVFIAAAALVVSMAIRAPAASKTPTAASGPASGRIRDAAAMTRAERIAAVTGQVMAGSGIRENLRVLCDEIGGRVTGTEAGRKARGFAERTFTGYGLDNVRQESFEMFGWEGGDLRCEVVFPRAFGLEALALAYTPSTPPGGLEAEVAYAAHGNPEELEKLGYPLEGKFALVESGRMPGGRWMHRSEVMAEVVRAGAVGMLYQNSSEGNLPMLGMCWHGGLSPIPGVGISKEGGEAIRRMLERGEKVRLRLSAANLSGDVSSANVVAEITGRGRDIVVVGAHLDSWANGQGAVDNGTGSVVLMEAARAIRAAGIRPEATIRFVLFMGEEMGLDGSRSYVETHAGELDRYRAMINLDMEGTPLGISVMGREDAAPWFEGLAGSLDAFDLTEGISYRASLYGDHHFFLLAGVPVLMPVSRIENDADRYYHTSADTYDKVAFRQLSLSAAFVASVALELASTKERVMARIDSEGMKAFIDRHSLKGAIEVWGGWDYETGWFEAR
jgi:Zn-dependent M28 family amino/carboxypeptidase